MFAPLSFFMWPSMWYVSVILHEHEQAANDAAVWCPLLPNPASCSLLLLLCSGGVIH
jgi:hypothetical protein